MALFESVNRVDDRAWMGDWDSGPDEDLLALETGADRTQWEAAMEAVWDDEGATDGNA